MAGCAYAAAANTLVNKTFPMMVIAVATRAAPAAGPAASAASRRRLLPDPAPHRECWPHMVHHQHVGGHVARAGLEVLGVVGFVSQRASCESRAVYRQQPHPSAAGRIWVSVRSHVVVAIAIAIARS